MRAAGDAHGGGYLYVGNNLSASLSPLACRDGRQQLGSLCGVQKVRPAIDNLYPHELHHP
jgi:hypothetical protein